jgi:hypothetical protein
MVLRPHRGKWLATVLLLLAITATACSSDGDEVPAPSSVAPTLIPTQEAVLSAAADAMGTVDTVSFTIERSGAPVHIDTGGIIVFNKAEGRFAAPTSADALVEVEAAGFKTEIGAIAFEGKTWLSEPITGRFTLTSGSYAFDPAALFDPVVGWRPMLTDGLTDIDWKGLDATTGRYRLTAVADPDRLEVITAGLVLDQEVVLDLYLDPTTGAVREVVFSTVNKGDTSSWLLTFAGYGQPVDVSPPPTTAGG